MGACQAPAGYADGYEDGRGASRCDSETSPGPSRYGTSIFEEYDFGQLLGSGSFGQVRRCWRVGERDSGQYALKVVDSEGEVFKHSKDFLTARQEVEALMAVRHQHIVELVNVFEEGSWILMVLERINGGELFEAVGNPMLAAFTEATVGLLGSQLLSAMQHMHGRGVMHRDVKAENILLASDPLRSGVWHSKLVDFGLATKVEETPAGSRRISGDRDGPIEGLICGTAYYCAPEVWAHDYGPKADVWALGVVLYLALHGTFPFVDRDPDAVERLIRDRAREPPFAAACPRECPGYAATREAKLCLACVLNKDADARPSARRALAEQTWLRPRERRDVTDQYVPMPVRLKAGRAAAKPKVSAALENGRTQALQALKAKHMR